MSDRTVLVISTLTRASLIAAFAARVGGARVIYLDAVEPLRDESVVRALTSRGIDRVDYTKLPDIDPYGNVHWLERVAADLESRLFPQLFVDAVARGFPQVRDRERKVAILLVEVLIEELRSLADAYALAEHLAATGARVRVLHHPSILGGDLRAVCRYGVRPLIGTMMRFWLALARGGWQGLLYRLLNKRQALASHLKRPPSAEPRPVPPVIYFPHKGVDYGRIYQKDHYYQSDPESPFHPSRILHVEWAPLMSSQELETVLAHYIGARINYRILEPTPVYSVDGLRSFRCHFKNAIGSLTRDLLAYQALVRLQAASAAIAPLRGAQIALVGYDLMFPRTLAVALQTSGIRVVAVQERFLASFFKSHYFILDDYFVHGDVARHAAVSNPWSCIDRIEVIGDPRLDLLAEYQTKVARRDDLVLVLDFHSTPDPFANARTAIANWANNALFYRHILTVARRFPQLHFVIRGKDDVWMGLPVFADIREAIEQQLNIEVDRNYATFNQSYRLAAAARVVIARYTSLVDQCLAMGKPVLVHECLVTGDRVVSCKYDYAPYPLLTHSLKDLIARLEALITRGQYMADGLLGELRATHYISDPRAGVRRRLARELNAMLPARVRQMASARP
jgi:hypothetical protein